MLAALFSLDSASDLLYSMPLCTPEWGGVYVYARRASRGGLLCMHFMFGMCMRVRVHAHTSHHMCVCGVWKRGGGTICQTNVQTRKHLRPLHSLLLLRFVHDTANKLAIVVLCVCVFSFWLLQPLEHSPLMCACLCVMSVCVCVTSIVFCCCYKFIAHICVYTVYTSKAAVGAKLAPTRYFNKHALHTHSSAQKLTERSTNM